MLAIQKSKSHKGKCTPNVLPCRINHNGPVNASKRYWEPRATADSKTIAYFRGRKLHGKQLKIPKGYRGIVISSTDRILPKETPAEDDEDAEEVPEVKVMEEQSEFEDMMVWGHEALLDDTTDPYMRGVQEWIAFADQIHSQSDDEEAKDAETK